MPWSPNPRSASIIMLSGQVTFTIGGESTLLAAGDCLFAVVDRPTLFKAPSGSPAEYLVIQEPA